ncbi:hypothetical protein EX30DRAFT_340487 [Ascodesmis nigricans]|uniref:Uncharacterized protein n=1 Tax=Ascodesmis nigricans TaxID=341454 RepID=A0A4S2MY32_9PEZI|nr:hypothetical protein EX30DRAFT_340487 [Ascodesmis nigricans]
MAVCINIDLVESRLNYALIFCIIIVLLLGGWWGCGIAREKFSHAGYAEHQQQGPVITDL